MKSLAHALVTVGLAAVAAFQWKSGTANVWTILFMLLMVLSWLLINGSDGNVSRGRVRKGL